MASIFGLLEQRRVRFLLMAFYAHGAAKDFSAGMQWASQLAYAALLLAALATNGILGSGSIIPTYEHAAEGITGASYADSVAHLLASHIVMGAMTVLAAMFQIAGRVMFAAQHEALHIEALTLQMHAPGWFTSQDARACLLAKPAVQRRIVFWSYIIAAVSFLGRNLLHTVALWLLTANARFRVQCVNHDQAHAVVAISTWMCVAYLCAITLMDLAARPQYPQAVEAPTSNMAQRAAASGAAQ